MIFMAGVGYEESPLPMAGVPSIIPLLTKASVSNSTLNRFRTSACGYQSGGGRKRGSPATSPLRWNHAAAVRIRWKKLTTVQNRRSSRHVRFVSGGCV
jgi:hypothetical protein